METDASYLPDPPKRSVVARIVALAALFGIVAVLIVVVNDSLSVDSGSSSNTTEKTVPKKHGDIPKEYTVQEGDTISGIAEKYGISVTRITRLNPDLDSQTMATGQVLKLH